MDSGSMEKEKEEESSSGKKARYTKDTGRTARLTDRADSYKLQDRSTKENGLTIKLKERVSISIRMEARILVNGSMTNSMAMVIKNGLTEHSTKGIMLTESSKDMELSPGFRATDTKDSLNQTISKATAAIPGSMADPMKAYGKTIKCTERAFLYGQMVGNMRASTLEKSSKDTANSLGQMDGNTKETGKKANKMERGYIEISRAFRDVEFGAKAKRCSGLIEKFIELKIYIIS